MAAVAVAMIMLMAVCCSGGDYGVDGGDGGRGGGGVQAHALATT